jgi:hypothetical protein
MQKRFMLGGRLRSAGLVAVTVALTALAAPGFARANAVTEWNLNASTALMATAGQPPQQSVVHLAMVHGAIYDAVNAIDRGYRPYLGSPAAQPWYSKEAATATAAYLVLANIVPLQQPTLEGLWLNSLAPIPDGPAKAGGIAVGEDAANAMTDERANDGRFGPFRFSVGTAPGEWRPVLPAFVNDPNAWLKDVRPFLIRSASQFRSRGPFRLTSSLYAQDFAEVKELGSLASETRSEDQTHTARYWAENPPNTWQRVFRTLDTQQGLSLVDSARFYAMLNLTGADALISVWDDKEHHSFWRPITAIREADTDGNPATDPDAEWMPLIATPPYPDHPSGHSALSGSYVKTLQHFFGTDEIAWTDTTNGGLTRTFTRFSQAIAEVVDARVWSGIHFREADEQGEHIGRQVAKWRQRHYFQPMRGNRGNDAEGDD